MTDLEMTKLCAEAMGILLSDSLHKGRCREFKMGGPIYDPLTIDEQAMALVKKFTISLDYAPENGWYVHASGDASAMDHDLNRAIVECAARLERP